MTDYTDEKSQSVTKCYKYVNIQKVYACSYEALFLHDLGWENVTIAQSCGYLERKGCGERS